MSIRNSWAEGDHLAQDDITGFVHYGSEMRKTWDGLLVHESVWKRHRRNPQEFVKARRDPVPVFETRKAPAITGQCEDVVTPVFVGNTTVRTSLSGPGANVFNIGIDSGLGDIRGMEIGCSFVVR